jgi:hypothetical protein
LCIMEDGSKAKVESPWKGELVLANAHQHQHQPSSLTNGSVSRFNCRNTSNGFM